MIKGQEVLPDGSTLDEHGIIDGSTVNIVIEPDKEINLNMKLGPTEFSHKVLNSLRVRELKQRLIDDDTVGFMLDEFTLMIPADNNYGITADVPVEDESLPLHLYGVGDNTKFKIIGWSIMIEVINQSGERCFKYFPRKMTVKQMKKEIRVPTRPGKPGKPGKMRVHLENLEISWNFVKFNKYHGKMTCNLEKLCGY